jgi:hypothetical protein
MQIEKKKLRFSVETAILSSSVGQKHVEYETAILVCIYYIQITD